MIDIRLLLYLSIKKIANLQLVYFYYITDKLRNLSVLSVCLSLCINITDDPPVDENNKNNKVRSCSPYVLSILRPSIKSISCSSLFPNAYYTNKLELEEQLFDTLESYECMWDIFVNGNDAKRNTLFDELFVL